MIMNNVIKLIQIDKSKITLLYLMCLSSSMADCYHLVPLRAEQVSEANLRSKQGGINFTPFILSLPNAKKKKKKKN